MFSQHLRNAQRPPRRTLLLAGGAVLVVGQLGAMALLASHQVEKARQRESELGSQRLATAQCLENSSAANSKLCFAQISAAAGPALSPAQGAGASELLMNVPAGAQTGLVTASSGPH